MSTTRQAGRADAVPPSMPRLPPVQQGDHLTAKEFERRYDAMPHVKKAELIEGRVYMSSPVNTDDHGEPHACVIAWLVHYQAFTPGTQAADNATVRLDESNVSQPDGFLRIRRQCGGRTTTVDAYVVGGPELTAEVSASSASYDLHEKLQVFWQHGVQEYVVWRVYDAAIDWFVRGVHGYEPLPADDGIHKSRVFPGLWLDANAMLAGKMAQVLAVLQQGLAAPEHAAFCQELQRRQQASPSM